MAHCECGEYFKPNKVGCCDRCARLDGMGRSEQRIIAEMRRLPHATTQELADEMGVTKRHVLRMVTTLEKRGRLHRWMAETSGEMDLLAWGDVPCRSPGSLHTTVDLVMA